jgi:hypothetical protein
MRMSKSKILDEEKRSTWENSKATVAKRIYILFFVAQFIGNKYKIDRVFIF